MFITGYGGYGYGDMGMRKLRSGVAIINNSPTAVTGWDDAEYGVNSYLAGGEIGYDWSIGGLTITPTVGFVYRGAYADNYRQVFSGQHQGQGFAVVDNYSRVKNHSLQLPVELSARYEVYTGP